MKLSIITCTFNSEKFLWRCLDSIDKPHLLVSQFEHIIIDWESIDKTINIIEKYSKWKENIHFHKLPAKWVYNALNEWVKRAKWEYILFLNSDDFLEPSILWKYLQYIINTGNKDLYYWMINIINEFGPSKTIPKGNIFIRKFLFHLSFNVLMSILIHIIL